MVWDALSVMRCAMGRRAGDRQPGSKVAIERNNKLHLTAQAAIDALMMTSLTKRIPFPNCSQQLDKLVHGANGGHRD